VGSDEVALSSDEAISLIRVYYCICIKVLVVVKLKRTNLTVHNVNHSMMHQMTRSMI